MTSASRARQLSGLWSWLPVFRVVAETEHLPTAARRLHLTASSICRAIKHLEEELGRPLFRRRGRHLVLNDDGKRVLAAVVNGMSEIGEAVYEVVDGALAGPIRVAAPGPFVPVFVLPALRQVLREHPRLVPDVSCLEASAANQSLVRGDLDVALLDDPEPASGLVVERVRAIRYGVYCGVGHPLAAAASVIVEEVTRYPFVAPPTANDHWPVDIPRRVGFTVGRLDLGVELCATGEYLAVLPDDIVPGRDRAGRLRRLPLDIFPETALYAVHRERPEMPRRTEVLLRALRAAAAEPAAPRRAARALVTR